MNETCRISLCVNGQPVQAEVPARLTLADFLRQNLRLTGTHLGCEHGVCGACTVLLDGESVRACLMFAVQADRHQVTSIEGLTPEDGLSSLQQRFCQHHALQCGFCTPGMIVTVEAALARGERMDEHAARLAISGNVCRCTGYEPIIAAIVDESERRCAAKKGQP